MDSKVMPYKEWTSDKPIEELFEGKSSIRRSILQANKTQFFWTELRPSENGRTCIVTRINGEIRDIIPIEFNARSKVHEYGGKPFTVSEDKVYFVNFKDQRIYVTSTDGKGIPTPLTPAINQDNTIGMSAGFQVSPDNSTLLFVYEKGMQEKENENSIAFIDLNNHEIQEPQIIVSGNDFYGELQFSEDGSKICWVTWNHPPMPWDQTELFVGEFHLHDITRTSNTMKKIDGGPGIAICQPVFYGSSVFYVKDQKGFSDQDTENWWNIYQFDGEQVSQITSDFGEYGAPMWAINAERMQCFEDKLYSPFYSKGNSYLAEIDIDKKSVTHHQLGDYTLMWTLRVFNRQIIVACGSPLDEYAFVSFDPSTIEKSIFYTTFDVQKQEANISIGKLISYPTEDGDFGYAYFYSPRNAQFAAPEDDLPAVHVMVHGGPTSRTDNVYSKSIQYWTSSGFAVLDVDHRGSTGYGRRYRDKLLGEWGNVDAYDVKDAIKYVQEKGWISENVVISGGSAGGYAVQRGMTLFPDLYKAGASYYGIGNLATLLQGAHKFESRYLDQLLGGEYEQIKDVYHERSPINHMDKLKSPMILFQGLEDKVVTPKNSKEIAEMLDKKGIYYEHYEYKGEGHGFRMKETQIDALSRETKFYKKVLYDE